MSVEAIVSLPAVATVRGVVIAFVVVGDLACGFYSLA
jgi:hypothetical protein